jgi:hypothetical protein
MKASQCCVIGTLPVFLPMIQGRVILEDIKVACLMFVLCKGVDEVSPTRGARIALSPASSWHVSLHTELILIMECVPKHC